MTTRKRNTYPGTAKKRGRWYFYLNVEGKKRWHGSWVTQKEAADARAEALSARNKGSYVKHEKVTVQAYLEDEWLPTIPARVKPTTAKQYRDKAKYVIEILGTKRLHDVRPVDVEKMKAGLLARGLSPRTVTMAMQVFDAACKHARDVGQVIVVNPCDKVSKPRKAARDAKVQALSPAQVQAVLRASEGTQWQGFLRLAFYTGARRGELMGLRWSDVDFDAKAVTFRANIVHTDDGLTEQSPKSGRSRTVTVDDDTLAVLRLQRREQVAKRLELGQYWQGTDEWVTIRPDGSDATPNAATVAWARFCRNAGVSGFRLHDTRHTHATHLLANGVPLHVVAARLGHRDPMVTASIYAHVLDRQAVDASAAFVDAMHA